MCRILYFLTVSILFCCLPSYSTFAAEPPSGQTKQAVLLHDTIDWAQRHQEFRDLHFKQNEEEFVRLIQEGQQPQIAFIGCSDSRVIPELILNARNGEVFVIRVAGNFVPPALAQSVSGVAATLQYAVEVLKVSDIIVCGHSHCGAVKALFQELDPNQLGLVQSWIRYGEAAKNLTLKLANPSTPKEDIYKTAEEINVLVQLENLFTYPFIKQAMLEGRVNLHGWYFDIAQGQLMYYNTSKNDFVALSPKALSAPKGM